MKTLRLALVLPLLLTGCLSIGAEFPAAPVGELTIDVTTQQDVRTAFGDPWRTGVENGQKTWTYGEYRYAALGGGLARDLVLRFDPNGVLKSYTYNTTEPE